MPYALTTYGVTSDNEGTAMHSNRITTNSSLTVEDFGHEVVAIDLTDGSYFSLKGSPLNCGE